VLATSVGDEGGFAPDLASTRYALDFIMASVEKAGFRAGEDVVLALDCAATEFFKNGKYEMTGEGKSFEAEAMVGYLADLCERFPIVSIEDGCSEDDFDGWRLLTERLGDRIQIVGDDLFDNPAVWRPARSGYHPGQVNQIGTLSETLDAVDMAHRAGYTAIMNTNHRRPRRRHQLRAD
jgi:enolase